MIDLGSTDFYFRVPSMPPEELEAFSSKLFDIWEARVAQEVPLNDYALALEIEEGSIKGSGKVLATLIAVGGFLSHYGSISQGIETLHGHVVFSGRFLTERAHGLLGADKPEPTVRKRSGTLGQLQRLFVKIQRGEMSADEAIAEAEQLLGPETASAPDFIQQLSESFRDARIQPKQMFLAEDGELCEPAGSAPSKRSIPRPLTPRPAAPPANQFRVEVWRESKRGKKHIRIVPI